MPQIGRPIGRAAARIVGLVLQRDLLADGGGNLDRLAAGRLHLELDGGGRHQILHQDEGLAGVLAHGQKAVVLQHQRAVLAERLEDALALAEILGDAFVGVIADALVKTDGLLRNHPQPVFHPGQRHAGLGVDMHRAIDVGPALEHAAVQREARPVDARLLVEVVVHVDLAEIRGGDLGPQQLMLLHQEFAGSPGTRIEQ